MSEEFSEWLTTDRGDDVSISERFDGDPGVCVGASNGCESGHALMSWSDLERLRDLISRVLMERRP